MLASELAKRLLAVVAESGDAHVIMQLVSTDDTECQVWSGECMSPGIPSLLPEGVADENTVRFVDAEEFFSEEANAIVIEVYAPLK